MYVCISVHSFNAEQRIIRKTLKGKNAEKKQEEEAH